MFWSFLGSSEEQISTSVTVELQMQTIAKACCDVSLKDSGF